MIKWNKKIKAQKWAEMVKENIAYVHERDLMKRANLLVLEIGSIVLMLVGIVFMIRG